ncbi:hypothetical protein JTE90_008204 [Oedothorax gibbosus]|uniref:Uncharacterized protein n=1 Tax=Oedothorax gibbosus TaxID=931172 RepID=A0AAV6TFD6_9ARAC|nr:hypothetical protein JTE90_008204 [Oedothorax gibbosus]
MAVIAIAIPARKRFNGLPIPVGKGKHNDDSFMWPGRGGPGNLRALRPAIALPRGQTPPVPSKKNRWTGTDPSAI